MLKRLFASRNNPCFASASRWDTLVYDLSGSRLEITLPPQDYEFPEEDNGKRFNLFDPNLYKYNSKPDSNGFPPHGRGVTSPGILRRNWYTYGSIGESGNIGSLQSAAVICDTSRMNIHTNCFIETHFEQLFMHALYYNSGPGLGRGEVEFNTPINWKIQQLGEIRWIYCESWKRKPDWLDFSHGSFGCHFTSWLATPLFSDKYLLLSFSAAGSHPAEPSNLLMLHRINEIIPSIKLTLSPEAQKQRIDAQLSNIKMTYSEVRKPEEWRYYERFREGNYEKGEPDIIFEGSCTPPPLLY